MPEPTPSQIPPEKRDWTFMVYMAAGDSHKLDTVAVRDLQEMEAGIKGNRSVAVVVQINRHWPATVQRYEITSEEGTKLIDRPHAETDMGDEKTLSTFLTEVVANPKYQAEKYCLVLWGHAFGVGFGRDDGDALLLPELRGALQTLKDARGKNLDLLGTNACSMSYLEAAFELKDVANLMVASQITTPFAGWPYSAILSRITGGTPPMKLAKLIVDAYVTQFDDLPGGDRLAMTILNLTHAKTCGEHLRTLGSKIHNKISDGFDTETLAALRDVFMGAAAGDVRPLVDLTTLCKILRGDGPDEMVEPIVTAAEKLLGALQPADPPFGTVELTAKENDDKLVAYHRAHAELTDVKGIGVYAPFITDQGMLDRLELAATAPPGQGSLETGFDKYQALELFQPTEGKPGNWPTLVYKDLKRTIPSELMVAIDGIGELQTGDRADVAQIIMSIEAVLNGLDRAIARGRRDIIKAIVGGPPVPTAGIRQARAAIEAVAVAEPVSPTTAFGPPWIRLLSPLSLQALKDAEEMKNHQARAVTGPYLVSGTSSQRFDVVDCAVKRFELIERAIGVTERVVRRGLTHARFGLGPLSPNKLNVPEPGKPGSGLEPTKPGSGLEPTKPGSGLEPTKPGSGIGDAGNLLRIGLLSGDLRADLALARVLDLFKQVGESLAALEAAAAGVEDSARSVLVVSPASAVDPLDAHKATVQDIDEAFRVLAEAAAETRRTMRRVLAHPVYGLGPGEDPLSYDLREQLAVAGGLSKRALKLL